MPRKQVQLNAQNPNITTETANMVQATIEIKEITIVTHNSILISIANSINAETLDSRITISMTTSIYLEDPVKTATGDRPGNTTDHTCSISKVMV